MVYIPPRPAIWLPLDERSGMIAYDKSGNTRNGTLTGAVWSQYHRGTLPGSGCVLWLQFDEGGGLKVFDFSGYNNSGDQKGISWGRERYGIVGVFDGTDDYIEIPHSDSLSLQEFTIEAFFRCANTVQEGGVLTKRGGLPGTWVNEGNYQLEFFAGKYALSFLGADGVWRDLLSISSLTVEYIYFVGTYKDGTARVYINGEKEAEESGWAAPAVNTSHLVIGAAWNEYFAGSIKSLSIFRRELSEEEIKSRFYRFSKIV